MFRFAFTPGAKIVVGSTTLGTFLGSTAAIYNAKGALTRDGQTAGETGVFTTSGRGFAFEAAPSQEKHTTFVGRNLAENSASHESVVTTDVPKSSEEPKPTVLSGAERALRQNREAFKRYGHSSAIEVLAASQTAVPAPFKSAAVDAQVLVEQLLLTPPSEVEINVINAAITPTEVKAVVRKYNLAVTDDEVDYSYEKLQQFMQNPELWTRAMEAFNAETAKRNKRRQPRPTMTASARKWEELRQRFPCSICHDVLAAPFIPQCSHSMCWQCLQDLRHSCQCVDGEAELQPNCPSCKSGTLEGCRYEKVLDESIYAEVLKPHYEDVDRADYLERRNAYLNSIHQCLLEEGAAAISAAHSGSRSRASSAGSMDSELEAAAQAHEAASATSEGGESEEASAYRKMKMLAIVAVMTAVWFLADFRQMK